MWTFFLVLHFALAQPVLTFSLNQSESARVVIAWIINELLSSVRQNNGLQISPGWEEEQKMILFHIFTQKYTKETLSLP